ncbi:MAG: tyrosine-type recombinase/integrase [Acetobacteraceae bacterium]
MPILHAVFEHAVRLGTIENNPGKGARRLASTPRDRRLSRAEIAKLGKAMRAAGAAGEHPTGLAAIRLLLLTGFRRFEGLGLRRDWLDAEEAAVRFPDTKSGAQLRVIGRSAVELLLAQPQTTKSPFFSPADWREGHFIGIVRVLDRVRALAGLADVTPHTLRHTFASVVGHVARGVTRPYVHIDEALRMVADNVAGEIAAILDGGAGRSRAADRQPVAAESALEHAPARRCKGADRSEPP